MGDWNKINAVELRGSEKGFKFLNIKAAMKDYENGNTGLCFYSSDYGIKEDELAEIVCLQYDDKFEVIDINKWNDMLEIDIRAILTSTQEEFEKKAKSSSIPGEQYTFVAGNANRCWYILPQMYLVRKGVKYIPIYDVLRNKRYLIDWSLMFKAFNKFYENTSEEVYEISTWDKNELDPDDSRYEELIVPEIIEELKVEYDW